MRSNLRRSGIGQRTDEIGEQIDPDARPRIDKLNHELRYTRLHDVVVRNEKLLDHAWPHGFDAASDKVEIGDCVPRTISSEPCHAQLHGKATRHGKAIQLNMRDEPIEAARQSIRLDGQESLNHYRTPVPSRF